MIIAAGKPLLQWVLEWLRANMIHNIVIGVAYKKEKIVEYFGDGSRLGLRIASRENLFGKGLACSLHVRS